MTAPRREPLERFLKVRRFSTGEIVHQVEVTGRGEREIERILMGMLRNMNTEDFCVDDTAHDSEPKAKDAKEGAG